MDIQLKLSTLKQIVEQAELTHRSTQNEGVKTVPLVRIYKTASRQHGELEDKYEHGLLVKRLPSSEVVEG